MRSISAQRHWMVVAVAVTLAHTAIGGSPAVATEMVGTIDIKHPTNPIVLELPGTGTGPCGQYPDPELGIAFDGDQDEGEVTDLTTGGKWAGQSPSSGNWYQFDANAIFHILSYNLKSEPPPWIYHIHGLVIFTVDVYNIGHPSDPGFPNCEKDDLKCIFVLAGWVKGILYNDGTALPTLDPDAVLEVTGTTDHPEGSPLIAITECGGEIGTFEGIHVNMDLEVTDFAS